MLEHPFSAWLSKLFSVQKLELESAASSPDITMTGWAAIKRTLEPSKDFTHAALQLLAVIVTAPVHVRKPSSGPLLSKTSTNQKRKQNKNRSLPFRLSAHHKPRRQRSSEPLRPPRRFTSALRRLASLHRAWKGTTPGFTQKHTGTNTPPSPTGSSQQQQSNSGLLNRSAVEAKPSLVQFSAFGSAQAGRASVTFTHPPLRRERFDERHHPQMQQWLRLPTGGALETSAWD